MFCIGFQKTGTSSLRDALEFLGYSVAGVFGRTIELSELRRCFVEVGLEIAKRYDAVEDMPWPLMFRELDAAFPGSKFILSVRDEDRWYESIADHFGSTPYHLQQLTYGDDAPAPVGHETRYREVFNLHYAAVRDYFEDRPGDLLEMNLSGGDGWEKLCHFLGLTQPATPFPRTNSAKQRRSLLNRARKRLAKMGLPIPVMDR